jgi:hypothetical protein
LVFGNGIIVEDFGDEMVNFSDFSDTLILKSKRLDNVFPLDLLMSEFISHLVLYIFPIKENVNIDLTEELN